MSRIVIKDRQVFDDEVWQTETDFTEQEYNDWLHNAAKTLQEQKDMIEDEHGGSTDTYVLGDIVNLLSNTSVVAPDNTKDDTLEQIDRDSFRCILEGYDMDRVIDVLMADLEDKAWDYDIQDAYVEQNRNGSELRRMIKNRILELL